MHAARRFRLLQAPIPGSITDLLEVGNVIDDALQPGNFFVAPELRLTWVAAKAETIRWEIFRGRLVEAAHTRQMRSFLSWHVVQDDSHVPTEPIVSVKLDLAARAIHVVRGFLAYVWEGQGTGNVIESQETIRWTRELVGTIALNDFTDLETLRDELICVIWQALVGTSRLPLHSVEAPLPAYLFGQLHYAYRPAASAHSAEHCNTFFDEAMPTPLAWIETVKLVEFALRASVDLGKLAERVAGLPVSALLRALFNNISLSPWTTFVDNTLALLDLLVERRALTPLERIDFLSWLLRQVARHLTAFDLVTFHHRGANYPDALLLDATLRVYLREIDRQPEAFVGDDRSARLRRRALRQALLLRRHYEGLAVPDAPTSPGENARVLPASHPRVPEEQLTQTLRRRRKLYGHETSPCLLGDKARQVFAQSLDDLTNVNERTELGLGVFIDRPLGYWKAPAEPDQTPLVAHEAFSPALARARRKELQTLAGELGLQIVVDEFPDAWPVGLPQREVADCPRPVAALADVRKVADDFVILRALPNGLATLLDVLDLRPAFEVRLLAPVLDTNGQRALALFDTQMRRQLELRVDSSLGWRMRAGIEEPRQKCIKTES